MKWPFGKQEPQPAPALTPEEIIDRAAVDAKESLLRNGAEATLVALCNMFGEAQVKAAIGRERIDFGNPPGEDVELFTLVREELREIVQGAIGYISDGEHPPVDEESADDIVDRALEIGAYRKEEVKPN